ncbi:MAG: fibronectin type III domain-containing protein, partial [Myxococcales bacterium]
TLAANTVSYEDTSVTAANSYSYRLRGRGGPPLNLNTNYSATASPLPAGAPTGLAVAPTAGSGTTSLTLTWVDTLFNETGFILQQRLGAGLWTAATPAEVPANATTATITGLQPDTEYAFRVRAKNAPSEASWSAAVTGRTRANAAPPVGLPEAPAELTATAQSTSSIQLAWKDQSDNETAFNLEHSTDGVNFTDYYTSAGANVTTALDANLPPGSTHHYRVRAKNQAGFSAFSNVASATTFGATAPAAPSNLTAAPQSSTVVRLQFINTAADAEGFDLQASGDGTQWSVDFGGVRATTIDVTNLTAQRTYYFRVRAFNRTAGGQKQYSDFSNVSDPVVTPAGNQTVLKVVNLNPYPVISLKVGGVERFGPGQGIPVATASNPSTHFDAVVPSGGSYAYEAGVGFWNGNAPFILYTFRGTATAVANGATQVPVPQHSIGQLLTFRGGGTTGLWVGEVWSNGTPGSRGFCFNQSGAATRFYVNGVSQGPSGTATVPSFPRPGSYIVKFHLGDPSNLATLDELHGYFFYRNGPPDWPL